MQCRLQDWQDIQKEAEHSHAILMDQDEKLQLLSIEQEFRFSQRIHFLDNIRLLDSPLHIYSEDKSPEVA